LHPSSEKVLLPRDWDALKWPVKVGVYVPHDTDSLTVWIVAKDVTVELQPGKVRFWASLRSAGPRQYLTHEWHYGGYEREVEIPAGYGSGLEATLTNGQLAIRVLRGESTSLRIQPTGS